MRPGRLEVRIWDVAPRILCRSHLLGEHREIHAVAAVLTRGHAGYRAHPETKRWAGKMPALAARHDRVVAEMRSRGYRHGSPLSATRGSRIQRVRLLSRDAQIARLEAKPCSCPRPTTTKEMK